MTFESDTVVNVNMLQQSGSKRTYKPGVGHIVSFDASWPDTSGAIQTKNVTYTDIGWSRQNPLVDLKIFICRNHVYAVTFDTDNTNLRIYKERNGELVRTEKDGTPRDNSIVSLRSCGVIRTADPCSDVIRYFYRYDTRQTTKLYTFRIAHDDSWTYTKRDTLVPGEPLYDAISGNIYVFVHHPTHEHLRITRLTNNVARVEMPFMHVLGNAPGQSYPRLNMLDMCGNVVIYSLDTDDDRITMVAYDIQSRHIIYKHVFDAVSTISAAFMTDMAVIVKQYYHGRDSRTCMINIVDGSLYDLS